MRPLISIIVPCYNQAQYMDEALQSVLEQNYQNWECIIINDGSPDNTEEIAQNWVNKDSRFKYIKKENGGVSETRNLGISKSIGKYILPLDADDKISPDYLSEAINIFEADATIRIVYSNTILFGLRNEKLIHPEYQFENMFISNQIFNSAIFKREDFPSKGYNVNMVEGLEDWDFWLNIVDKDIKVVKLDGFHLYYRIRDVSRSTLIDHDKNERLLLQIFKNHQEKYLKYFNPIRDHIEADFYKKEVSKLKKQPEWYIGRIVYSPVRFAVKVWRRLFR